MNVCTTIEGARATSMGMPVLDSIEVYSLQELHAELERTLAAS